MKVLAVCGFGVGSSMILRMTLEKAFKAVGIECEVENTDITSARGVSVDAIFTSYELAEELKRGVSVPVYAVQKYMDLNEVTQVVSMFLSEKK